MGASSRPASVDCYPHVIGLLLGNGRHPRDPRESSFQRCTATAVAFSNEVAMILHLKAHDNPLDDRELNEGVGNRVRWTFRVSSAVVAAFLVSLIVRSTGSYLTPVDGWGVDLFEIRG